MEKPLEPPPPVFQNFRPQDKTIARVTHPSSQIAEKPDVFEGCRNGSDMLLRLLDSKSEAQGNILLTRSI